MSEHTPGPWFVDPRDNYNVKARDEEGQAFQIARCAAGNAHLIAAAPELLEALTELSELAGFMVHADGCALRSRSPFKGADESCDCGLADAVHLAETASAKARGEGVQS